MQYHYIASQPDGKVSEGDVDAKDVAEVLTYLTSHGLRPVSVKPIAQISKKKRLGLFGGTINLTDQIFLSKYLALMLKIGTSLLQAINILVEDFQKSSVRAFLVEIRSNLEKGRPFHTTFAKYPKIFSQVYINLVKAGEASGNLENVFENLTASLSKEKMLKDQMRSALVYPILLLVTSALILVFLVTFALPKIAGVFLESGFEPPLFSRVVFSIGLFFGKFGILVIAAVFGGAIALVAAYRSLLLFKKFVTSVISEIPVIKDIIRKIALQRFAATLASLIKAGVPLTNALEITADAAGNIELKQALLRISREGLMKGLTVGDAFKREPFFPRTVVNLVAISEKAGHIEEVLETLADFYTSEIDSSLKTLVSFLEPALLLVIGFIIGLIALAIIVPIYQLTTQF
ncbi:MAG: 3-isopropylmalate dehydrogenase [Candidatus Jorgensenbacteria bacterium GW2011_GWA1_48_13]|uniref:3-isopropylmalate dehydrogenase n=1 Tax=Candidatus Jorgensenbacteria bacterium GW2011_GWB1_50_10 TaxID=1618665 RepID=A0A0G1YIN5_9BACT|nr:MAG: 3-isopropylmalate dehydrogenase [Parcubacteria group bacterium GW2011_GWC1_45_9]KKU94107.1 MAG: 3-isopropylmalate dehydrogenase [Candidatus Jorgensenbacteria bacterium GW2011_GWA1_48_13]KKW14857.1 MAG: 3-isopropylmalate dehydrogenase [Candidatus Jorgensenbacteria bacterium GW2011_GWB1_50_10]